MQTLITLKTLNSLVKQVLMFFETTLHFCLEITLSTKKIFDLIVNLLLMCIETTPV